MKKTSFLTTINSHSDRSKNKLRTLLYSLCNIGMKKAIYFSLFLLGLFFVNTPIFSQYTPKGMNYQAVARDEKGLELKNKELEVMISILANDPNSTAEYSESHTVTTDKYGLFSLTIGQGSYNSGSALNFDAINWGSGIHYLKLEVDFGFGWRGMGTTQFLAVPYALYAGTASNAMGSKDEQKLSYDPVNKKLSLDNGGDADLSSLYEDGDSNPVNELQHLSWNGSKLSICNDNNTFESSVVLTDLLEDADHEPTNEIQDLQLDENSNILKITKNPGANAVFLQKYLDNTDHQFIYITGDSLRIENDSSKVFVDNSITNEIQTLSRSGNSIILSKNGGQVIDSVDDADNNPKNELQAPKLTDNDLTLTNDPNSTVIKLDKYIDNTDDQTISRSGYNITIESGGTVNIRPDIFAFRGLKALENSKILYAGDSTILVFPNVKLNLLNGYNSLNGKYVVPSGGEGLYHFDLIYQYSTGQSLKILVNGLPYEQIMPVETFSMIIYLTTGETVEVQLKSSGVSNPQAGVFSGYRIH